jgi:large subunit ribosomal protein L15
MPLQRRVPKFGFYNRNRIEYQVINVGRLQELAEANRFDSNVINLDVLYKAGVVAKSNVPVKVLGNGEISAALNLEVAGVTETAKQKIESAGGTVTING